MLLSLAASYLSDNRKEKAMQNLAGNSRADDQIRMELDGAGIPIEPALVHHSEVPYTIIGKLGDFTFTRAWYYWVVKGRVPIKVARELYDDPVGRTDIRTAGFAGNTPPEAPWVEWLLPDGRHVSPADQEAEFRALAEKHPGIYGKGLEEIVWSDDPEGVGAECFVTSYHIDSYEGLKRFVSAIKQHGLAPVAA